MFWLVIWFSFLNFVTSWFFYCALLVNFVTSLLCIIFLVCPFDEFCCVFVMCSWWVSLPPCYASPLVSFITSLLCTLSELCCSLVVPCLLAMSFWWIMCCFIDVHHLLLCTCGTLWQLHLMYHFDPIWCSLSLPCCAFDCLLAMH